MLKSSASVFRRVAQGSSIVSKTSSRRFSEGSQKLNEGGRRTNQKFFPRRSPQTAAPFIRGLLKKCLKQLDLRIPAGVSSSMNPEEIPEGPGPFQTIGAMSAGALGALFIAGIGVFAVFKMAFYIAGETGRSIHAQDKVENSTRQDSGSNSR